MTDLENSSKGSKFCSTCGASVFAEAEICVKCGVRLAKPKAILTTDKSRMAYALLYLFLGVLGVHEFYANKSGKGVAWLLGSIIGGVVTFGIATLILSFVAFIMGIVWLTRTDEDFAQYVNN